MQAPSVEGAPEGGIFYMVQGRRRHGLLVDPGASLGIIGSDTLREYISQVLEPKSKSIRLNPSGSTFSGISGGSESTKGCATIPITVPGMGDCTFAADIVGGKGSYCPGLLPNSSMRSYNMSLFTNLFTNGDGILAVAPRSDGKEGLLIRVILTDSGHYLLPTDGIDTPTEADHKLMRALVHDYTESLLHGKRAHKAGKPTMALMVEDTPRAGSSSGNNGNEGQSKITERSMSMPPHRSRSTASTSHIAKPRSHSVDRNMSRNTGKLLHDIELTQNLSHEESLLFLASSVKSYYDTWSSFQDAQFTHDMFPEHLGKQTCGALRQYYRAMPEEFYKHTQLPVVTPTNCIKWINHMSKQHCFMIEIFSGSSRLSCVAADMGLSVGFPIDYRYGWNLSKHEHQVLALDALLTVGVEALFA